MGRVARAAPQAATISRRFTRKQNPQEIPRLQNQPRPLRLRGYPRTGKSGANVPLSGHYNDAKIMVMDDPLNKVCPTDLIHGLHPAHGGSTHKRKESRRAAYSSGPPLRIALPISTQPTPFSLSPQSAPASTRTMSRRSASRFEAAMPKRAIALAELSSTLMGKASPRLTAVDKTPASIGESRSKGHNAVIAAVWIVGY
jgi:hypothetical protein